MSHATFAVPDLTTFAGLDGLGLEVVGQRIDVDRAVLACRVVEPDQWCRRCGCEGMPRDSLTRRLAHEPFGWRPTVLLITVRRYRCMGCGHVWRQDTSRAAEPRAKLSRRGLRWALEGIVIQHLTVARVAEGLGVAWNTANSAVLAEGQRVLIDDPTRFDGVRVIGVDEHVWRHTRKGDKYVTVIIDLTPIRDNTGPARLLDMVEGRSKAAFKTWLAEREPAWRAQIEVVAMDGFTGFKTAAAEELADATTVMDPFHVVRAGHEAPCVRMEVRDLHQPGRRSGRAEAEGSLSQEVLVRVGSSPDKRRGGPVLPDGLGPANEAWRCVTRENQWLNLRNRGSGSNLADVGRAAVRAERTNGRRLPGTVIDAGPGRPRWKACGVLAAMLPEQSRGTALRRPRHSEHGPLPCPPYSGRIQQPGGQGHRRPDGGGRGRSRRSSRGQGKAMGGAKGGSESATRVPQCQEVAGEYRTRRGRACHGRRARFGTAGCLPGCVRWSTGDTTARFDDLFNLVVDPAFLVMAWERVAGNRVPRVGQS